jgi:hypothetical protein
MTNTTSERVVLVRCVVDNRNGSESLRFIEQTHYRLWQYMMVNKHDLRVRAAAVALWLPATEFEHKEQIFSRSGTAEAVDRIAFAVYDRSSGLVNTIQRFCPRSDTEQLRNILLARFPEDVRASDDFTTEHSAGYAIRTNAADASRIGYHFPD